MIDLSYQTIRTTSRLFLEGSTLKVMVNDRIVFICEQGDKYLWDGIVNHYASLQDQDCYDAGQRRRAEEAQAVLTHRRKV